MGNNNNNTIMFMHPSVTIKVKIINDIINDIKVTNAAAVTYNSVCQHVYWVNSKFHSFCDHVWYENFTFDSFQKFNGR